jgi:mono/diheme cytochrome c family protein
VYRLQCASCHGDTGRGDGPAAADFDPRPPDLRGGFMQQHPADELVSVVRDGRDAALSFDMAALRAHAEEVEQLAAYVRMLPDLDWPVLRRGAGLFADRCAECHGPWGRPGPRLPAGVRAPRDLSDGAVRGVREKELIASVRHGRHGMPALTPRVRADEAQALAAYVRLFAPGFTVYVRYCASCHGDDGRPPARLPGGMPPPAVRFDRAYFAQRDPERLRADLWHMAAQHKPTMPHFRDTLGEAEVRAALEYLKHLQ